MGKRQREVPEWVRAKSRAAVTLANLNCKFRFLYKATSVLDLSAATGGWMHLAVVRIPKGGSVVGVDLHPIQHVPNAISVQGDVTTNAISIQGDIATSECRNAVRKLMSEKGITSFDVVMRGVLSPDPNATAWDHAAVLTKSVRVAMKFLSPDGAFVTKMFDGAEDFNPLLYVLGKLFCKVDVAKPTSTSAETYIVAIGYKAPENFDRSRLVPRNLFAINEERKLVIKKVALASDFVWSETPNEILSTARSLSFDDDAGVSLKNHSLTTEMVRVICKDLRVMDRQRYKCLMTWRLHVREALSHAQKHEQQADPSPQARRQTTTKGLLQELVLGQQRLERKVDCMQEQLQFYFSQTPELAPGMAEIVSRWADPEKAAVTDDSEALSHAEKATTADLDKQKRQKKRKKTV